MLTAEVLSLRHPASCSFQHLTPEIKDQMLQALRSDQSEEVTAAGTDPLRPTAARCWLPRVCPCGIRRAVCSSSSCRNLRIKHYDLCDRPRRKKLPPRGQSLLRLQVAAVLTAEGLSLRHPASCSFQLLVAEIKDQTLRPLRSTQSEEVTAAGTDPLVADGGSGVGRRGSVPEAPGELIVPAPDAGN